MVVLSVAVGWPLWHRASLLAGATAQTAILLALFGITSTAPVPPDQAPREMAEIIFIPPPEAVDDPAPAALAPAALAPAIPAPASPAPTIPAPAVLAPAVLAPEVAATAPIEPVTTSPAPAEVADPDPDPPPLIPSTVALLGPDPASLALSAGLSADGPTMSAVPDQQPLPSPEAEIPPSNPTPLPRPVPPLGPRPAAMPIRSAARLLVASHPTRLVAPPPSQPAVGQLAPRPAPPVTTAAANAGTTARSATVQIEQSAETALRGRIREAVQAAVRCPAAARMMGLSGKAGVAFDYRDGALLGGVRLTRSTGTPLLDSAALAAVRDAHYPTPPPEAANHLLRLLIWVEEACGV